MISFAAMFLIPFRFSFPVWPSKESYRTMEDDSNPRSSPSSHAVAQRSATSDKPIRQVRCGWQSQQASSKRQNKHGFKSIYVTLTKRPESIFFDRFLRFPIRFAYSKHNKCKSQAIQEKDVTGFPMETFISIGQTITLPYLWKAMK